jgi:hypothetical protein
MKKSTLFALAAFIVALYLAVAVVQNYGPLHALPFGVLAFFATVFFSCVCDHHEQKQK